MLRLLGQLRRTLADFYLRMAEVVDPAKIDVRLDCCDYETGPIVEMWAEVTLDGGRVRVWSMDIRPTLGRWSVDAELTNADNDTIGELESRDNLSFDELKVAAPEMLRQLLSLEAPQ